MRSNDVCLGVAGLGYWGPHFVRNGCELEGVELVAACDPDANARARLSRRYRHVRFTPSFDDLLSNPEIDGIVVATPIATHYALVRQALLAGKHVLVEKPLSATVAEGQDLIRLARQRGLTLMPGHTFLYSPPVLAVKRMIENGELGDVYFGTSTRVNLGIHRSDVSVIRDLGPHDFSILLAWMGKPSWVRAIGRDAIFPGLLDVAFLDVAYDNGCIVRVELSWLAPTKLRRTVLVGTRKMVVYDDTSPEQLRVYDRGVNAMTPESFGEHQLSYRSGDILTPRLDADEPLRSEMMDFVTCIRQGCEPRSDSMIGLDVLRMVEACELSVEYNGAPVYVDPDENERRRSPDRRHSITGRRAAPSSVAALPA
jgi:predicted dehydrogenase